MSPLNSSSLEWLEADGLGGFASGTAAGFRTRRYHALLLTATTPPTGRMVLVNGFDAWVETSNGTFSLSSQCYGPSLISGEGIRYIEAFEWEPWPKWIFKLPDETRIELEIFSVKHQPITCVSWKLLGSSGEGRLFVRPFLSGRDYHGLHKRNDAFRFEAEVGPDRVSWAPYDPVPAVTVLTNGSYSHEPDWYYNFYYEEERARGLDCQEDLATPGVFSWNLTHGKAALLLTTKQHAHATLPARVKPVELLNRFREAEQTRREEFPSTLHGAADAYIVQRGEGKTIVAGYPWFTDWGRDTLIALRGLCIATGRLEDCRDILLAWSGAVSEGMLPNRFPDQGGQPEFNSVDASLWFVIAVHEFLQAAARKRLTLNGDRKKLLAAVEAILSGYSKGTRFGIRADGDGLLMAGDRGTQLTWMDAKIGEWTVTPRVGKPVEIQALWLNALWIGSQHNDRWKDPFERGLDSFQSRFYNPGRKMLYDVIDVDHQRGVVDATFRPNQILAAGGLPLRLLEPNIAFQVTEAVKDHLWTPLGLRSLAPGEPGYRPAYTGDVFSRDSAYHQGTVWPWLIGAFVDAWVRVHERAPSAILEARRGYLQPLLDHLAAGGLGHLPEIADGEEPHLLRGCPWQAWSVGEALWLDQVVLAPSAKALRSPKSLAKQIPAAPTLVPA